jgi:hypothetical protein
MKFLASAIGNQEKAKEKASKALDKKSVIKFGICNYIEFWKRGWPNVKDFAETFHLT